MSTKYTTHETSSTDNSVAQTQNLVNANSGDRLYVYRDGDRLAVENAIQTAEFHLDDLVVIYDGLERHQVQFVVNIDSARASDGR